MKATILVIEDNERNMYLATYLLEKAGYRVLQAQDGRTGVETARREKPDLILLDIQLPLMNGYAVAQELKKAEESRNAPIIAVTSYAMVGDRERSLEAGCVDYIEKPIDPSTFIARMERHLPQNRNTGKP
jgi:two-component system cell cycle response regulator DivK